MPFNAAYPSKRALRSLFALLVTIALFATSCGSDPDSTDGASDAVEVLETDADPDTGTADPGDDAVDPEIEEADADAPDATGADDTTTPDAASEGGDTAPSATKEQVAATFTENLTALVPSEPETTCIIEAGEADPMLDALFERFVVAPDNNVSDEELGSLARAVHVCLSPAELAAWVSTSLGVAPADWDTTNGCLVEPIQGPDGSDLMVAISLRSAGRLVAPEFQDRPVAVLTDCVPVTILAPQLAYQNDAATGFATTIDVDCLRAELGDSSMSESFWTAVMAGDVDPSADLQPSMANCSVDPFEGLADSIPADFEPWAGTGALAGVRPELRNNVYIAPPPMSINPDGNYEAVITTSGAEIRLRLFADSAPVTVNNFVSLARDGYYDGTVFHRVLDEFMAQAGDPTGTGTGGPGYQFGDEVDGGPSLDRAGLLAMANAGPGTNGSQFFITFVPTDWLTGNHTVFGEVVEGQDVVDAIERRDPSAAASRGQLIESIVIIES